MSNMLDEEQSKALNELSVEFANRLGIAVAKVCKAFEILSNSFAKIDLSPLEDFIDSEEWKKFQKKERSRKRYERMMSRKNKQ